MSQDILTKQNIFTIPAGDIWELPEEKVYILYAPLGGHISLATDETRDELLRGFSGSNQKSLGYIPGHGVCAGPLSAEVSRRALSD